MIVAMKQPRKGKKVETRFLVEVFTSSAAGAQERVEVCSRATYLGAAELRGIMRAEYPPHAYVITITETTR